MAARFSSTSPADSDVAASPLRWRLLFGVWLVYVTFSLTGTSLAPLADSITRDLAIGHGEMGLVFGIWQMAFIVMAVPCGMLLDRLGPRWGLFLGVVIIALSSLLRSLAPDYLSLCLAVALFGLGGPIVSAGAPKVIGSWFRGADRGFAMGIYMTGPALGGILTLSLTNAVLMPAFDGDWQRVLQLWAGLGFAGALLWLWLAAVPAPVAATAAPAAPVSQRGVLLALLGLPVVRVLLGMSIGIFFFNHALNNWLPTLLMGRGLSAAEAGYWATIPTLVGIAGSLLIPRLAIPRRRYLLLGGLCLCALLASLLLQSAAQPVLILGLLLQGIARSSLMTIAMLTLVETPGIGERHAGTAAGLFFAAAEMGGATGPIVLGLLHDRFGSFAPGLGLLSLVAALLFCGTARLVQLRNRAAMKKS